MAKQSETPRAAAPRKVAAGTKGSRAGANLQGGSRSGTAHAVRRGRKKSNTVLLLWIIGGIVVLVVGLVLLNLQTLTGGNPAGAARVGAGTAWGPENAPVKIIEYSNFGCSHCKNFAEGDGRKLQQEYEAAGKVRFEFRQFKLGDPSTADAANASLCAADQQRFWDFHDKLFAMQGTSATVFSKGALKSYGKQMGLDATRFDACVDNDQQMATVNQNSQEGSAQGVDGTPTFFINGEKIVGEIPYTELKSKVDAAIQAKS